jgi:hypothetical protein
VLFLLRAEDFARKKDLQVANVLDILRGLILLWRYTNLVPYEQFSG